MSEYTVGCEYPYPIADVWVVLTAPEYVSQWTTSGRGGRQEDFAPVVGRRFRLVGKPTIGWAGVVYCEVLEVEAPHLLRYTWRGDENGDDVTDVTYRLEAVASGTRFTWVHRGFTGPGGFLMSTLLGRVRRRMLTDGVPAVLAARDAASAA